VEFDTQEKMRLCEQLIQYEFVDKSLLLAALTHASGADTRLLSNERMEFLGDAILGMVICQHLFDEYPQFLEGDLTKIKSIVVSRSTCARISKRLGLGQCLLVGKGMQNNTKIPNSLLSDVLESLVAAIRIDGGLAAAHDFIARLFFPEVISAVAGELDGNYKSFLQQHAQRHFRTAPVYRLVDEYGPDHQKQFKIRVEIGQREFAPAWGRNKKQAEQRAAHNALAQLDGDPPIHPDTDTPLN
jgi:ribonuclease-3